MSEYCKSGCELGECRLKVLGQAITVAAELASIVGVTDNQTTQIVDAHGKMVNICTEYAASELVVSAQE